MRQYHIFHSTENKFDETEKQDRQYVGYVNAESLEEAYTKSQNIEDVWNPTNPCRSTSVGDVIQDDNGFHLVCGVGFKQLTLLAMIIIFLSSCQTYTNLGEGGCGAWGPKQFEKDKRQQNRVNAIHARNRSFRHY